MILYFSATGNSRYIAELLAKRLQDVAVDISESDSEFVLNEGESIGFVFPVHSWGMPKHLRQRISQLRFGNVEGNYCYLVCTCGDDTGLTAEEWSECVRGIGLVPKAEFSVQMPNTYVLLPGFDVDKKDVEAKKLSQAACDVEEISYRISEKTGGDFTYHGGFAWVKSKVIRPPFMKFMGDKMFYADDSCSGCGLCVKKCPVNNIIIEDGKPIWRGNCINCLACYHYCPHKAINYGHRTKTKGQYYFKNRKKD